MEKSNEACHASNVASASILTAPKTWLQWSDRSNALLRIVKRVLHRERSWRDIALMLLSVPLWLALALRPRYMLKNGMVPKRSLQATSYLDALRGWAAFIVVNHHFLGRVRVFPEMQYTSIFLNGSGMVHLFYVVSGYVLSYRVLRASKKSVDHNLLDIFTSSIFRRYFRLYGAAAIASFASLLLVCLGLYEGPTTEKTILLQFRAWATQFLRFANPIMLEVSGQWNHKGHHDLYLNILWTIPVEFRGSMILWLFCLGTCRMTTRTRVVCSVVCIMLCLAWSAHYVALFLGGLTIAELALFKEQSLGRSVLPTTTEKSKDSFSLSVRVICVVALVLSFCLLSPPLNGAFATGHWPWPQVNSIVSQYYAKKLAVSLYFSLGAFLLVLVLETWPILRTPLHWQFSQYLGDLSFGIYVMHVLVMRTLWPLALQPLHSRIFHETSLESSFWSHLPFLLLMYAGVLWAADLFSRVDAHLVRGVKVMETRLFAR